LYAIYRILPFPLTLSDPFHRAHYAASGYGPPGNPGHRHVPAVPTILHR